MCNVKLLQVFKNPYEVVTVLLIQTLGAMVPSVPVCLSAAMERAAQEERLDTLLELHRTTSTFGCSLEAAMLPHLGLYKHRTLTHGGCERRDFFIVGSHDAESNYNIDKSLHKNG